MYNYSSYLEDLYLKIIRKSYKNYYILIIIIIRI